MIKKLFTIFAGIALLCSAGCTPTSKETVATKEYTPLEVTVPERPTGQQDVIELVAPKLDTVRVGFIGLGMRGPSAVERWTHIPGTKIIALCDLLPDNAEKAQKIVTNAGMDAPALYSGSEDAWNNCVTGMISTWCTSQRTGNTMPKWVSMPWNMEST